MLETVQPCLQHFIGKNKFYTLKKAVLFLALISSLLIHSQQITISGLVRDGNNKPIENAAVSSGSFGTITNHLGFYTLKVSKTDQIIIQFSFLGYNTVIETLLIKDEISIERNVVLKPSIETIREVEVRDRSSAVQGNTKINREIVINNPAVNSGVESVLLTLPGVNNANELSTQYNVRGGNFDENLVYINGIEIYRPFMVRSGQQEGLSIINPDMVQNVRFSAGGFQARFGDKMSSVLNILYREPDKFSTRINASLLGGGIGIDASSKNAKLKGIIGMRYRDNSLLINNKDTEANADPNFTDIQTFLSWEASEKITYNFLGYHSSNVYKFIPKSRQTNFGTAFDPKQVNVYYSGKENDLFKTVFGAFQMNFNHSEALNFQATTSIYHSLEEENYDIAAAYFIEESDSNNANPITQGIGSQLNHARNTIDALVGSLDLKGSFEKEGHKVNVGIKFQQEDLRDRINEWEVIDSLGFNLRPPGTLSNSEPRIPFTGELVPFHRVYAENELKINRLQWFAQYNKREDLNGHEIWYTLGIRSHHWNISGDKLDKSSKSSYSLRGQFAIKPNWERNFIFRFAAGMYAQPPSYKELREAGGTINPQVESQKSFHLIFGGESSFKLWNRPFKLESDIYYKNLSDLNAYTLDNVRIRYRADNVTEGYSMGLDLRLFGEFVPGTMSWVSVGLLKTMENINNQGFIPRPTDQRFKFALLFQDYVPNIPNVRMYLNLVYNSGLPGGSPTHANPYDYQYRLSAYKRADLGINYVFKDGTNLNATTWLNNIDKLTVGIEVFNMFDVRNATTTTWVRDVYSKRYYGVPNYMTPRVFNIKLKMKF